MKINEKGVANAKALIKAGAVDVVTPWEWTTADENKILGDGDWKEYEKWFLAIDEEQNEETKARYKFPFGKNGKVYRSGLIAIRQRAGQFKYDTIFEAAGELLQMIDEAISEFEGERWITIFWNGRHKNKGAKKEWNVDDVARIYEKNKERQIPIVVKHPADDLPIVGFAKGLRKRFENGRAIIDAKVEKISKWFFDFLKQANLDKVSIALDSDLSTIRHIGLVDNPAIEGMPAVSFSENEYEYVFNQMELKMEIEKELTERLEKLEKENNELKEKLTKFEAERREWLLQNQIREITSGLGPKQSEKVERLIRLVHEQNVEFEGDKFFEALKEVVNLIPKVEFKNNVTMEKDSEVEIEKIVEMYNKNKR